MSVDGQGTKRRRNIAQNFNRLSRAHERYRRQTDTDRQTDRQTTDGLAIAYSEREREFTFAKNSMTMAYATTWKQLMERIANQTANNKISRYLYR